jgi:excisionase family DNA binding protein
MASGNLTTKHVARLLQISEATVKRWADSGALRPDKTIGGHRRFSIHAVAKLRREHAQSKKSDRSPRVRNKLAKPLASSRALLETLLAGEDAAASAALIDAYLHGHSLITICDTLITESMHMVGDLWMQGDISVADEHLATRVMLAAVQQLRGVIAATDPNGLSAICCGIEGDLHELPIHLAEIVLESEGWSVINLGPNTPLFSLREMVAQKRPQVVCVSARMIADLDRSAVEFAPLKKLLSKLKAQLVLGGEAFRDPNLRRRFPADLYANTFQALSKFASSLQL